MRGRVLALLAGTSLAAGMAAIPVTVPAAAAAPDVTVTAVADTHVSAGSVGSSQQAVAALVGSTPSDAVLMPGDLSDTASAADFVAFDGLYGTVKGRIRPAPGNHDFEGTDGAAYFDYFGPANGTVSTPWYSFDLGAWHVVSLAAAPDPGSPNYWSASSPQLQWLAADLSAHATQPTLAEFHAARFSGAEHGDNTDLAAIWNVLYAHHVELAINGHDHVYQRFAPQNPSGVAVSDGVREIMVSTGGAGHNAMSHYTSGHNLQAWNNTDYGVTTLTLGASSYSWKFTASDGSGWTDSGTSPVNPQHLPSGEGNQAPVAVAGADQSLTAGPGGTASVNLDGTGSYDPDGDPLTYQWSENGTILAGTATPTITLPVGTHALTLTATDPAGLTGTDTVTITIAAAPAASMHVAALTDSSTIHNRNRWRPAVTVRIVDQAGAPVRSARTTFQITGLVTGSASCTTSTSGSCVASASTVSRHGTVTFTVTDVTAGGRTYLPGDNLVSSLGVTH